MINTEVLEKIGLTKGEIKVYFALLELGDSTIGPISKKSNVTSSKTYPILERLSKKGLITSVIKSGTTHFQAFNPNRILNYVNEKKKELEQQEKELKEIIPRISQKQTSEAKQGAVVYEGYKGLKTLYNEFIEELSKSKEDFIAFTLGDEYKDERLTRFFEHYDLLRKEKGIKTKLIGIDSQRKFFKKDYLKKAGLTIKFLPYSAVPQGAIIVGDKIATMVWSDNPVAFVIQSKEIASAYKNFFGDLWKSSKS